jgi:tetratricopeptide (TPR) repeat protein
LLFSRWINFRENVVKFLVLMMLGSFAFALLIDPKLGYARDWDLFAFVGLGVTFLGSYLLVGLLRTLHQKTPMPAHDKLLQERKKKNGEADHEPHGVWLSQVTLILLVTSLISTLPYILVNASQERAIARFEDLLKTDEKGAALGYEILACFFRDKGEYERTIRLWKNAIRIDPNPRYFASLGNAYIRLKEYDKAIEAYDRSIKEGLDSPGIHRIYKNLGTTLARVGRYDEAVVQLKRAISLRPQEAEYYDILGNILGKAERFEEALLCFEMVLSLKPDDVSVYKSLGICYFAMGEIEKARGYLKRYLKTAPPDFPVIKAIVDSIETQLEGGR